MKSPTVILVSVGIYHNFFISCKLDTCEIRYESVFFSRTRSNCKFVSQKNLSNMLSQRKFCKRHGKRTVPSAKTIWQLCKTWASWDTVSRGPIYNAICFILISLTVRTTPYYFILLITLSVSVLFLQVSRKRCHYSLEGKNYLCINGQSGALRLRKKGCCATRKRQNNLRVKSTEDLSYSRQKIMC